MNDAFPSPICLKMLGFNDIHLQNKDSVQTRSQRLYSVWDVGRSGIGLRSMTMSFVLIHSPWKLTCNTKIHWERICELSSSPICQNLHHALVLRLTIPVWNEDFQSLATLLSFFPLVVVNARSPPLLAKLLHQGEEVKHHWTASFLENPIDIFTRVSWLFDSLTWFASSSIVICSVWTTQMSDFDVDYVRKEDMHLPSTQEARE